MKLKTLLVAIFAIALSAGGAAAQQKTVLKIANWVPAGGVSVRGVMAPLADMLERDAGDVVEVQRFWGGSLGRSAPKQYDLIKDGVIDIGWHVAGYTPGLFPQLAVFELPFVAHDALEGSVALQRAYEEGLFSGLDDVRVVALHTAGNYALQSKAPVTKLTDMKGMKVSISGAIQGAIVKHYGGVPLAIPADKVTESIDRGVVSAAMQGWSALPTFKIDRVTSYHIDAPLGMPSFMVIMNKSKYESLPAKAKAALAKDGGLTLSRLAGAAFLQSDRAVAKKIEEDPAHHMKVLPRSAYPAAIADLKPLYDERLATIPNGRKIYDRVMAILAEVRAGK